MSEGWTETRVDALRTLWAEGHSASHIAARLGGISRNAVIGKVHRLGLAARRARGYHRSSGQGKASTPAAGKPGRSPARSTRRSAAPRQYAAPSRSVQLRRLHLVEPAPLGLSILDLTAGRCKWPTAGDPRKPDFGGFCGHPAPGSYCDHHHLVAHR